MSAFSLRRLSRFKNTFTFVGSSRSVMSTSTTHRSISELIKSDHDSVRHLYTRFQSSQLNPIEQQRIANQIISEISTHSTTEEIVVYPAFQRYLDHGKSKVTQNLQEHQQVKQDLAAFDAMKVGDKDYSQTLDKIITEFAQHASNAFSFFFNEYLYALNRGRRGESIAGVGKKDARSGIPTIIRTIPTSKKVGTHTSSPFRA